MSYRSYWGEYVPVAQKRARAALEMSKLKKKGISIQPVKDVGRGIAVSFWGKGWCDHLESFSDYDNRLPRGRTYVRNGSVCHLEIKPERIEAMVAGSELYKVDIKIKPLTKHKWTAIKNKCSGHIGSALELLQGRLSKQVMAVVADQKEGLFPAPEEIELNCSCPDWAEMCKHVAAALYGAGNRLDSQPELLFALRNVDVQELISANIALPSSTALGESAIADGMLGDIFGVDVETGHTASESGAAESKTKVKKQPLKAAAQRPSKKKPPVQPEKRKIRAAEKHSRAKTKTATPPAAARPVLKPVGRREIQTGNLPQLQPTGKSIAKLRKKLGMTVKLFADTMDVSQASVKRWESTPGRLKLQKKTLDAIAVMRRHAEDI